MNSLYKENGNISEVLRRWGIQSNPYSKSCKKKAPSGLKFIFYGRAWIALREDEIACQAMGIDKTKTKLTAFALGATWAGMMGVVFAAKTTFINLASFTIWESIIVLCIVVLGGMGSIVGVIFGALVLILTPEYLRAFSEYRMLLFGAILVIMMVFRPQGFITNVRRTYEYHGTTDNSENHT